jgi:serine/threonine protein kinase/Flp pilus assembly protein TadD
MNEQSIFTAALERDPAERQQFLDEACGSDAGLRQRVERLIAAHEAAASFMDQPAGRLAQTIDQPVAEQAGTRIGPYKLLQEIGQGGMGVVYMAEQTEPVQRKVALKIIKPGMDSNQVVARFEAERQALAMMDHTNIAKVLDAGTTESGRPYFVMELVRGVPITRYCDERRLTPKERLELFVPVCQAVQHAHQKGIIHRDLKPSNVLVAEYDDKPVAKVIDFGVAKATGPKLTERTMFTELGQIVGTLEYMSPEQAKLNALDIDTRSDIYALGVLLYELLTGTTPVQKKRLHQAAFDEMLRIIREEEPPKPSTRLSTTEELPSIAANRGLEPKKLNGLVRGELDWIVMKALEKDRNRRYETANGLAHDIERYLNDEPVQACPPSAAYRFRKFARRNKAALVTAAVVALAVLLAVGSIGWVVRDRQAQQVVLEREIERALQEATSWSERGNFSEGMSAVKRAEGLLASGRASTELRQRVAAKRADLDLVTRLEEIRLEQSTVKGDRFDTEAADARYRAAFRDYGLDVEALDLDEVRIKDAVIKGAIVAPLDNWANAKAKTDRGGRQRLLRLAARVDPDPYRCRLRDALLRGDKKALEKLGHEAVAERCPVTADLLARALYQLGMKEQAVEVLRRVQKSHLGDFWINQNLGQYLREVNQPKEAVRYFQAALALRPDSPGVHVNLSGALYFQGRFAEAEAECREALRLKPDYLTAYHNLGMTLRSQHKIAEAEAIFRKIVARQRDFAFAHNSLGELLCDFKADYKGAEAAIRQAIRLEPGNAEFHKNLGVVLNRLRRPVEAERATREALRLQRDFAHAYITLGDALAAQGRWIESEAASRDAVRLAPGIASAHRNLGAALASQGKTVPAEAAFREALRLDPHQGDALKNLGELLTWQGQVDEGIKLLKESIRVQPAFADTHYNLGAAYFGQRKFPEALAAFRETVRLKPNFAEGHNDVASVLAEQGQFAAAETSYKEALRLKPKLWQALQGLNSLYLRRNNWAEALPLAARLVAVVPNNPAFQNQLAWQLATCPDLKLRDPARALQAAKTAVKLAPREGNFWNTLGVAHYRAGDWREAIAAIQKSMDLRKEGDPGDWFFLALAHARLGEKDKARKWYDQAVRWMDEKQSKNPELLRFQAEAAEVLKIKSGSD